MSYDKSSKKEFMTGQQHLYPTLAHSLDSDTTMTVDSTMTVS